MTSSDNFEDIRRYLPQYLSREAEASLFENLAQFPANIDSRMYSRLHAGSTSFFQGDGVRSMPFVNIPDPKLDSLPAMIVSNTCDISPENPRLVPMRVVYAPVFNLGKFIEALSRKFPDRQVQVSGYVESIRRQMVSNVFYLPVGSGGLGYEGIVPLDRVQNAPVAQLRTNTPPADRLFALGNYGWYLFLYKLSIHFSRIREGIERD